MTWPFENDTSTVEKRLAGRSLKADRRRNVFSILTIALAVCLMGIICFLYSAQQMQTLDNILGQYQAGCSGLTKEEVTRLVDAGKFEKWGYAADAGSVRYEDSVLKVDFVSKEMIDLMGYGEITGNYPKAENELCVERSFLDYFDLPAEVDRTLTLNLGSGEKDYTVTGILESEDNSSRIFTVWISEERVGTDSHQTPYDLQFRFEGSQGMEPEQLKRVVKRERRLLVVAAIPFGLFLAAGIALAAMPGYWSWRDNLKSAVVISFLAYGMVLIATRKPLSMVGKVSGKTVSWSVLQAVH